MISVCMATYNGEKYIKEQLDSILVQLSNEDEVVVSDDGSTDSTLDIIRNINDSRIKIYPFNRSKVGISTIQLITTNVENALSHANGDVIFLSDQDDVWLPDKVSIMLKYLKEYDYVVSDCYVTDSDLNIKHETRFNGLTRNRWKALIKPTPYQGSCAAFNKKVLDKALPFPKGLQSHDRWIGYIASFFYKYRILDERLIYYRRHDCNNSAATNKSKNSFYYKMRTRIKYIFELLKIIFK